MDYIVVNLSRLTSNPRDAWIRPTTRRGISYYNSSGLHPNAPLTAVYHKAIATNIPPNRDYLVQKLNFPLLFLGILILRDVIKGASVGDAIALAAVAGLYGYQLYCENKKVVIDESIRRDIEQLKHSVDGLKVAKSMSRAL
jgi:hypothetical protein